MKRLASVCIAAAAIVIATASARADTIVLKNKSIFSGKIVKQNEKQVTIQTDFGQITFNRDQVRSVAKSKVVSPYKPKQAKANANARAKSRTKSRRRGARKASRPVAGKYRGPQLSPEMRAKIGSIKGRISAAQKAQLMAKIRRAMKNNSKLQEMMRKARKRPG